MQHVTTSSKTRTGQMYISFLNNNLGYYVAFPKSWGIQPHRKSFTIAEFGSLENALAMAIDYRDLVAGNVLLGTPVTV